MAILTDTEKQLIIWVPDALPDEAFLRSRIRSGACAARYGAGLPSGTRIKTNNHTNVSLLRDRGPKVNSEP